MDDGWMMDDRDPWPTWNYRVGGGTCSFPTRGNRTGTPKGPRPHVCRPPPDTDRSSRDLVHISRGSRANKTRMNGMRWMDDRWMMMMAARPAAPHMCVKCAWFNPDLLSTNYPISPGTGPRSPWRWVCRESCPGVPDTSARGSSVPCRRPAAGLRGGPHPAGLALWLGRRGGSSGARNTDPGPSLLHHERRCRLPPAPGAGELTACVQCVRAP